MAQPLIASTRCSPAGVFPGSKTQAKRGAYPLPRRAEPGARPDLEGLSCRWGEAPGQTGVALSLIVAPIGDDPRFSALVPRSSISRSPTPASDRPVTLSNLRPSDPVKAIELETAAKTASALSSALALLSRVAILRRHDGVLRTAALEPLRLRQGLQDDARGQRGFPQVRRRTAHDARLHAGLRRRARARLAAASDFANWGAFRQEAAQLTCFVPSVTERGHVHFVDGAGGGYTMAAKAMKARPRRDAAAGRRPTRAHVDIGGRRPRWARLIC